MEQPHELEIVNSNTEPTTEWVSEEIVLRSTKANKIRAKVGFMNLVRLGVLEKRKLNGITEFHITEKGKRIGLSWRNLKM